MKNYERIKSNFNINATKIYCDIISIDKAREKTSNKDNNRLINIYQIFNILVLL
jgi:hypothetical protein